MMIWNLLSQVPKTRSIFENSKNQNKKINENEKINIENK